MSLVLTRFGVKGKLHQEEAMTGGDGDVKAAPAGPPPPLDWKFSQVFGERTAGEEVQEGKLASLLIT